MRKTLVRLQEECSELIHIICKIQRFGINDFNPITKEQNENILLAEICDVLVTAEDVIKDMKFTNSMIETHKRTKREKIEQFKKRERD